MTSRRLECVLLLFAGDDSTVRLWRLMLFQEGFENYPLQSLIVELLIAGDNGTERLCDLMLPIRVILIPFSQNRQTVPLGCRLPARRPVAVPYVA